MQYHELALLMSLNKAPIAVQRECREFAELEAIEDRCLQSIKSVQRAYVLQAMHWLENDHCGVVDWFDDEYPTLLRTIERPPMVLFYKGRTELLSQASVAMVGSRKASHYGIQVTDQLARECAQSGLAVVSGLAMGIDAAAHRAALDYGATIAVLGTGIDQIYPRRNRELYELMSHQGLIISEFSPGTPARMDHFPRRNRIISGMSKGVVVIEAARRSGSISTALSALREGREVGAVPNSIFAKSQEGCHWLLKEGAHVITCANDILSWFDISANESSQQTQCTIPKHLANNPLFANVSNDPVSLDELVERTGLSVAEVSEQLLLLELEGLITAIPGGYIKVGRR